MKRRGIVNEYRLILKSTTDHMFLSAFLQDCVFYGEDPSHWLSSSVTAVACLASHHTPMMMSSMCFDHQNTRQTPAARGSKTDSGALNLN